MGGAASPRTRLTPPPAQVLLPAIQHASRVLGDSERAKAGRVTLTDQQIVDALTEADLINPQEVASLGI